MIAYEKVCLAERPDWIIVVGDVNSTAACAMVGAKMWIRSSTWKRACAAATARMPEEINRLVTDAICRRAVDAVAGRDENLLQEGVARRASTASATS
jgi:UDP-N-acetylglucosamine 2-epimerase (non-hydrolysing)